MKTLSVYRVFGPTLEGTLDAGLIKVNELTDNADATLDFTADWVETGTDSFDYEWDISKVSPNGN
jgi:hypothetical protein